MIVRIMEENQYRLDDQSASRFEQLDQALTDAVHTGDQLTFQTALTDLVAYIRAQGVPVPYTEIIPSDVVVPTEDMTLAEAREFLDSNTPGA
jgi:hypothetical protein